MRGPSNRGFLGGVRGDVDSPDAGARDDPGEEALVGEDFGYYVGDGVNHGMGGRDSPGGWPQVGEYVCLLCVRWARTKWGRYRRSVSRRPSHTDCWKSRGSLGRPSCGC